MNKQEQLQELRHTYASVSKLTKDNMKDIYESRLLPIAQSCCDNGFKLKVSGGWLSEENVELTFDLGDWNKEFGLDFNIRLNSNKMIEISHGILSGYTLEQRPYLIQRDKVIGKLWGKETELLAVFDAVKKDKRKTEDFLWDIQIKISQIESEIEREETEQALKELAVGSKWYYKWDNDKRFVLTISKITEKLVIIKDRNDYEKRYKIKEIARQVVSGDLLKIVEG